MTEPRLDLVAHIREQINTPEKLARYCNDAKMRCCIDKLLWDLKSDLTGQPESPSVGPQYEDTQHERD